MWQVNTPQASAFFTPQPKILWDGCESILAAFKEVDIDASSEDGSSGTTERDFKRKIEAWEKLDPAKAAERLIAKWHALHAREIGQFVGALEASISRKVVLVRLAVMRGHSVELLDVKSAIRFLTEEEGSNRIREEGVDRESFEILVRFNNDAKVEALFPSRQEAISFLRSYER